MSKINVYVTENFVLTTAVRETTKKIVRDSSKPDGYRTEKTTKPTTLIGYMEAALVEQLPSLDSDKGNKP